MASGQSRNRYNSDMTRLPYQKLHIWQKGMQLTKKIYAITKLLPADERYGLISQMNRAAVSVPSNIAEGSQRITKEGMGHYLRIARGSLVELETQTLLCRELFSVCSDSITLPILNEIQELKKMMYSFQQKLQSDSEQVCT